KPKLPPIRFTKDVDGISPLIVKALQSNKNYNFDFYFYKADDQGGGADKLFYKIHLEDAHITAVHTFMTNRYMSEKDPLQEVVTIEYSTIHWESPISGKMDDYKFKDSAKG